MGIFTGRKKKKCEECVERGRRALRDELPLEARTKFSEVLHGLDPDNKTGFHVWACYGLALSSLSEAIFLYSTRSTDHPEITNQIATNLRDLGVINFSPDGKQMHVNAPKSVEWKNYLKQQIATMRTDEYILNRLQEAIKYFTDTLDLAPVTYDVLRLDIPIGDKISFPYISIGNIFGKVQDRFIMERAEKFNPNPHLFYSLDPLDLHCEYGIGDAKMLTRKIHLEKHGAIIDCWDPRLGDENIG